MEINLNEISGKEGINIDELAFVDATIEIVEAKDYTKPDSDENMSIIVQTNILKEGTKLRATEFIKLFRDQEGKVCYSESANSKATMMLKFFDVKSFEELKGKDCKVSIKLQQDGTKRVGIHYGN